MHLPLLVVSNAYAECEAHGTQPQEEGYDLKHMDQTKTMKNIHKNAQNTIPKTSEIETKCPFLGECS